MIILPWILGRATDRSWHENCIDIFGMVLASANDVPQQILLTVELAQFLHIVLWHSLWRCVLTPPHGCVVGWSDIMSVGVCRGFQTKKNRPSCVA